MSDTPNLALPLLAAGQAQKHVTHNEALLALDALVGCAILDRDLSAPPPSPPEGSRYLVAVSPTGAWLGQDGKIAAREGDSWRFHAPSPGLVTYVADEATLIVYDGAGWVGATPAALQNLTRLGIGTAADGSNPFSAKLNNALWTARPVGEGGTGDLRYVLNKESAADVLSFLFQSGYSGRAEIGLVGDDELQLKVSADGAGWTDALRVTSGGKVGLGTASPAERLTVAGNIAPALDDAYSIGTASRRPSAIYAATGVISTSDGRKKTDVRPIGPDMALELLRAAPPIAFRWIVGGVGEDGAERPGRRDHYGWLAQSWRDALGARDQDAGLFVKLDPGNPDGELALRPDQITPVIHAALLGLTARIAGLEERIANLDGGQTRPES